MKHKFLFVIFLIGVATAPSIDGIAQTRGGRAPRTTRVEVKAATTATPPPAPVDVATVFAVSTGAERWAIDEPMPSAATALDGSPVTLADRQVGISTGADGGYQLLFPVSWYSAYEGKNPELKYVVVRYRDGRACLIVAEYNAERVSMPRARFQAHPDGKSWYADLETVRQDGRLYTKQAVSAGKSDGKGGLWIESVMLSCVPER